MPRPILRLKFTDDVYGVPQILRALEKNYSIRESEEPDLVVFGEGKAHDHKKHPFATQVYVAVENRYPNFAECDYALTFLHLDDPRHLRLPMYVFDSEPDKLVRSPTLAEEILAESRDFCAFVVSNSSRRTERRLRFFHKLNALHSVNSGGRAFNNVGGPVANKDAFLRRHRFNLCFENHLWPGYTSEKLAHALAAGCIPIYWGNPAVAADFNPASFIHVSDFASDEHALAHILEVADSPEMQRKYLQSPCFQGNALNIYYDTDRLGAFFRRVVSSPRQKRQKFSLRPHLFKLQRKLGFY